MPICTTCTHTTPYLYTVYQSAHNLRLEQCEKCDAFADPYVEHDVLTLALDLLLLKRDVFRHLLFNRGEGARRVDDGSSAHNDEEEDPSGKIKGTRKEREAAAERERTTRRWAIILKLGSSLVLVDAFIRWSRLSPMNLSEIPTDTLQTWSRERMIVFLRILVGSVIETISFHAGVVLSCYIVLRIITFAEHLRRRDKPPPISGVRKQFRLSHVPLTIFYSSLTKLFLLFLLSIWHPDSAEPGVEQVPPYRMDTSTIHPLFARALELVDEDNMDREWIVRNVLGGMSTGFGLRVVLDCHPVLTTLIVLAGWAVKALVSTLVSSWVGGDEEIGEAWLSYSIP